MRIVVVLDWDSQTGHCEAESLSRHYVGGLRAVGENPILALTELVLKWQAADEQQAVLDAIDGVE